jgi:4-hydroxythreonine-4-phosphate dehydrogenase
MTPPVLALTQGDPAGIGPEILLRLLAGGVPGAPPAPAAWLPLVVAERAALAPLAAVVPDAPWERLEYLPSPPSRAVVVRLAAAGAVPVLDPVGERRPLTFGASGPADAAGALAALDAGADLARRGVADALVTAPLAKDSIARHRLAGFVGHTDYLARAAGLERYGRDYLMAFLAPDLQVALASVHLPLAAAVAAVERAAVVAALLCLARHAGGKIALAGLNPHAGEGGLLGEEDARELAPAVADARAAGADVHGPESADSLFARARAGEFDWVLALYHDQGLIAVKTAGFGLATNWTLGLPYLRTSVDHGTAFALAGQGRADAAPLARVVATTLALVRGELPRRR